MDRTRLDGELKKILGFCKEYGFKDSPPLSVAILDTSIKILGDLGVDSKSKVVTGLESLKHLGEQYEDAQDANDAVGAARILQQGQQHCGIVANCVTELGRIECSWTYVE